MLTTSEEVKELQKVLVAMRPELEKAAVEAQIMLDQIAADTVRKYYSIFLKFLHYFINV